MISNLPGTKNRTTSPWGADYRTTKRYGYPPPRRHRTAELEERVAILETIIRQQIERTTP